MRRAAVMAIMLGPVTFGVAAAEVFVHPHTVR